MLKTHVGAELSVTICAASADYLFIFPLVLLGSAAVLLVAQLLVLP